MQKQVIAICGQKRSGKDTIASYITYTYEFRHVKIAEPLKDLCKVLFGFTASQMEDDTKDVIDERHGITPRSAMQFVGTEMMQYKIQELLPNVGRNFWINRLLQDSNSNSNSSSNKIVISDMRFMHEYKAIKDMYGDNAMVIKVTRDANASNVEDNHASEKEWEQIPEDILIRNDTTVYELHNKIITALTH